MGRTMTDFAGTTLTTPGGGGGGGPAPGGGGSGFNEVLWDPNSVHDLDGRIAATWGDVKLIEADMVTDGWLGPIVVYVEPSGGATPVLPAGALGDLSKFSLIGRGMKQELINIPDDSNCTKFFRYLRNVYLNFNRTGATRFMATSGTATYSIEMENATIHNAGDDEVFGIGSATSTLEINMKNGSRLTSDVGGKGGSDYVIVCVSGEGTGYIDIYLGQNCELGQGWLNANNLGADADVFVEPGYHNIEPPDNDGALSYSVAGNGAYMRPVILRSGTFTVDHEADTWRLDLGSSFTVNLPQAARYQGIPITFKFEGPGAGPITIDPNGAQLIDGVANYVATSPGAITIVSNGSEWFITSEN